MLKWFALFDGAGALWAVLEDMRHAPVTGFVIPADMVSTRHVRGILRDKGIPSYGYDMRVDTLRFSVPRDKATWAERVLSDYGIPYQRGGK